MYFPEFYKISLQFLHSLIIVLPSIWQNTLKFPSKKAELINRSQFSCHISIFCTKLFLYLVNNYCECLVRYWIMNYLIHCCDLLTFVFVLFDQMYYFFFNSCFSIIKLFWLIHRFNRFNRTQISQQAINLQ